MNALELMLLFAILPLTIITPILHLFYGDKIHFRKYPKIINLNKLEIIEHYDLVNLYMKDGKNFTLHLNDYKKQCNSDSEFITLDVGLIARKDSFVLFDMYSAGKAKYKEKELSYIKNSNGEITSIFVKSEKVYKKLEYKIRDDVAYKC